MRTFRTFSRFRHSLDSQQARLIPILRPSKIANSLESATDVSGAYREDRVPRARGPQQFFDPFLHRFGDRTLLVPGVADRASADALPT